MKNGTAWTDTHFGLQVTDLAQSGIEMAGCTGFQHPSGLKFTPTFRQKKGIIVSHLELKRQRTVAGSPSK